jgi:hypothetical protein
MLWKKSSKKAKVGRAKRASTESIGREAGKAAETDQAGFSLQSEQIT